MVALQRKEVKTLPNSSGSMPFQEIAQGKASLASSREENIIASQRAEIKTLQHQIDELKLMVMTLAGSLKSAAVTGEVTEDRGEAPLSSYLVDAEDIEVVDVEAAHSDGEMESMQEEIENTDETSEIECGKEESEAEILVRNGDCPAVDLSSPLLHLAEDTFLEEKCSPARQISAVEEESPSFMMEAVSAVKIAPPSNIFQSSSRLTSMFSNLRFNKDRKKTGTVCLIFVVA